MNNKYAIDQIVFRVAELAVDKRTDVPFVVMSKVLAVLSGFDEHLRYKLSDESMAYVREEDIYPTYQQAYDEYVCRLRAAA